MIDALFFLLRLLRIPNFLLSATDENYNQDDRLRFCHVCHWYIYEYSFPYVFLYIVKVILLLFDCADHNGAHLRCVTSLFLLLSIFWTCFRVSTPKNPVSAAHYLSLKFFLSVAESPTISPVIFIAVFAPHTKKKLACDTDNDAAASNANPAFILGAANLCVSSHFPIVPSSHSFCLAFQFLRWEGYHDHVCLCNSWVFIYSIHVSLYQPFNNRVDKLSHLPVIWVYPYFNNSVQLPWCFSPTQKIGPRIDGSMIKILTCVGFFSMSCIVSSFKSFSLWLGLL